MILPSTRIHRSADGNRFYFIEAEIDPALIFTYSTVNNAFGPRVESSAPLFSGVAAVNRDGTLLGTRSGRVGFP